MGSSKPAAASSFILRWLPRLQPVLGIRPRALDLAMGDGRHTRVLAEAGFRAFGVDRNYSRVWQARAWLRASGLDASLWVADLECYPLGNGHFDLVVCSRYLQRSLWSALAASVRPGGFVLYETFTTDQRQYDWGPRASDHLLTPGGELRAAFDGWDVWTYDERREPAAEAQLVARKPLRER